MSRYKAGTFKHGDFAGMSYRHFNFLVEYTKNFNARMASIVCGYVPEYGYTLLRRPEIEKALELILSRRRESSDIDAEWVLMEAVDNHYIARQMGQMGASNAALNIVAKHRDVDAYAADKVKIDTAGDVVERLKRARHREEPPSFL